MARRKTPTKRSRERSGFPVLLGLAAATVTAVLAVVLVARREPPATSTEMPRASAANAAGGREGSTPSTSATPATGPAARPRPGSTAGEIPRQAEEPRAANPAKATPQRAAANRPAPIASPGPVAASALPAARGVTRTPRAPAGQGGLPRACIVLDDCGNRLDLMQRAVRLPIPITFAVIPRLRHSRASAELAHEHDHEVILHQPMEPEPGDGAGPGEGALLVGQGLADVRRILQENLADVPHAVGLNNHMGSRATSDPVLMDLVLAAVRDLSGEGAGFLFLDSRTSPATVARDAAVRHGVPSASRNVFLDNEPETPRVAEQLGLLLQTATAQGEAVGIGHLRAETLTALEALAAGPEAQRFRFVRLSSVVR